MKIDSIGRAAKLILGNPWVVCLLLTLLCGAIAWAHIDNISQHWNRLLTATLFGFSIGMIEVIEMRFQGSTRQKRLLGAGIGLFFAIAATSLLHPIPVVYCVSSMAGLLLGATASYWSKHINFI